jgi:DNA-binding transcriptional LysR family regulator
MATLRALECLVALVEARSVTAAAAALHMSQPALSHQISGLERELGTAVVERLPRGVRVTAAGHAAAEEARVALEAAERVVQIGRRVGAGRGGRVRIGCVETMTPWLLAPVLQHWRSRHPDVRLELSEFTSSDRMVNVLSSGGLDIAVGPRPTSTTAHVEVLGQEEMVVVAREDHQFVAQPWVTVDQLADQPFVHYDPNNGMSAWLEHFVAKHKVMLTPILRTGSPRTAAHLAGAGVGVTIVPVSALTTKPGGVVRRLHSRVLRDVIAAIAAPSDTLVSQFVSDLHHRGLPTVNTEASPPKVAVAVTTPAAG